MPEISAFRVSLSALLPISQFIPPLRHALIDSEGDDDDDDEVTYDLDCTGDLQSLYSHGPKVKDATNLDIPSSEVNNGTHGNPDQERQIVQLQSNEEHLASNSSSESISDEENMVPMKLSGTHRVQGSAYHPKLDKKHGDKGSTLPAGLEVAREPSCLDTKIQSRGQLYEEKRNYAVHSAYAKFIKGGASRVKTKFSDYSHVNSEVVWPHMSERNQICSVASEGRSDPQHRIREDLITTQMEFIQEARKEVQVNSVPHVFKGAPSIAELLEDLQEKDGSTTEASNVMFQNVVKERKAHTSSKKISLGTRILDDEDPLELMEDGMSSAEEEYDKNEGHATNKIKGQTMTYLFQEAFSACTPGALLLHKARHKGTGYFARLQQVIQIDKDRHLEFLNKLQKMQSPLNSPDVLGMTVRILSRTLEAKLTVCHCLLCCNIKPENEYEMPADEKEGNLWRTVIFSSKICGNVELEVGSLICVHPPWKEVMVNNDEKIILCSYFSNSNRHE